MYISVIGLARKFRSISLPVVMVQKHTLFILLNINVAIVMLMYDIKFPIEIDGFYCKGRIILVLGNNKLKHTQITSEHNLGQYFWQDYQAILP